MDDFILQKSLTGKCNLSEVAYLQMEVDTSETSIGNLGNNLLFPLFTSISLALTFLLYGMLLETLFNQMQWFTFSLNVFKYQI